MKKVLSILAICFMFALSFPATAPAPHCATDCNDEIACTDDTCVEGSCVHTRNDALCNDDDDCTDDYCDPEVGDQETGCVFVDNNTCDEGDEGCTPGYWKNHLDAWPEGYNTDDHFSYHFGLAITIRWSEKGKPQDEENPTLLHALQAKGGGESRLARHGTAALLSSAHSDVAYPLTLSEVLTAVQDGDIDTLEEANELGCPL